MTRLELLWKVLTEDADGVIHGLPGDDGQYIMTDGKDIWIDDYVDGVEDGIILDSGRDIREIAAWMYMPELPKKDRRLIGMRHDKHDQFAMMDCDDGGHMYINTEYIKAYGYIKDRNATFVSVLGELEKIYFPGNQTQEIRLSINCIDL